MAGELRPVAARMLQRALGELEGGDLATATQTLMKVHALAPAHPEVARWLGVAAQRRDDSVQAIDWFKRALAALPDDPDIHVCLGVALFRVTDEDGGLQHFRRACELAPDSVSAWYNLAEGLRLHADVSGALEAFQRVLQLDPRHRQAQVGVARIQGGFGHADVAAAALRDILRADPDDAEAWTSLADLKVAPFSAGDVGLLEAVLGNAQLPAGIRVPLEFVLARALEDQREYARAFDVLDHAHQLQRQFVRWDVQRQRDLVAATQRAFEGPVARTPNVDQGREVIFIVSPPRSGSSLVEQILASHPEVEGGNELTALPMIIHAETQRRRQAFPDWVPAADAADWQRLGQRYLDLTARWRARKPRLTDKSLLNWMSVGPALSMLPAARFVVVHRDPLETCLACYRQWFDRGAEFCVGLDELVDFYRGFWQLTRFWLRAFPDRVLDLSYESLVCNPEAEIRRLLDFCGLAFHPACLEFHRTRRVVLSAPSATQVHQPIRRNTARAARYGDKLDRLRHLLTAACLEFADSTNAGVRAAHVKVP